MTATDRREDPETAPTGAMPPWLAYILLAITVVAAVLVVASGNGTLSLIALVVVGLVWIFTMRRLRRTAE